MSYYNERHRDVHRSICELKLHATPPQFEALRVVAEAATRELGKERMLRALMGAIQVMFVARASRPVGDPLRVRANMGVKVAMSDAAALLKRIDDANEPDPRDEAVKLLRELAGPGRGRWSINTETLDKIEDVLERVPE